MIEPKRNIKGLFRTPPTFLNRIGRIERLDRNERTIPFPKGHLKKIFESIGPEEVVAYPELERPYKKLSKWLGVNRNQVLLTSGSDTGIKAVFEVYIDKGDEIITFPPTYGMYSVYSKMFGGVNREVLYNEDFSLPIERVLNAINKRTRLIIITNPNHTGTVMPKDEIICILKAAKKKGILVLLDEAYYHFYEDTMLPFVASFDNLIILRTFSKAFGIAPLRVGYLISNKDIISQLYKVKLTHEITSISARFMEYLLDHQEIMKQYVHDVRKGMTFLLKEFSRLNIMTFPTYTNFLFIKPPKKNSGPIIVERFREKGFHVSGPFSVVPINGLVRITVGPVKQMRRFIFVFKEIYKENI